MWEPPRNILKRLDGLAPLQLASHSTAPTRLVRKCRSTSLALAMTPSSVRELGGGSIGMPPGFPPALHQPPGAGEASAVAAAAGARPPS